MSKGKQLSNAFSTGSGGPHFEAHVQGSFVALMLTGGYAPCLPCWPIAEIKLQGKIDGFETDDLVVTVENRQSKEQRKLLGQVKHSVAVTQGDKVFGEVLQAAWSDFNNPRVFAKGKDRLALITGLLTAADGHNVPWLLNQARRTKNVEEFVRHVERAQFSPPRSAEKLAAIEYHLKAANGGSELSKEELYDFLRHFYLLGYDLGNEFGVVLSLLHSHISQCQQGDPQQVWSRICEFVQTWNQSAGTITLDTLPEDLVAVFQQAPVSEIPRQFLLAQGAEATDWAQHPDATYLALAVLVGAWNETSKSDLETVEQLFGISYEAWLQKAREMLFRLDSPVSLKNGIWKVVNRSELWNALGSRILDQDLDTFKSLAVAVLKERDPALELPAAERYAATIHGNVLERSSALRTGVAEGFALLGSKPEAAANCSEGKAEATCVLAMREVLSGAEWGLWASLNNQLPALAEAAPNEFLAAVEKALVLEPCPIDQLFEQEGNELFGGNYMTGLLWALEGLAWDEQYLVRVCVALGELASHDPGGQWANRPSNSLATILLPWLPQTLASVEKRKVAVQTLLNEQPGIAWKLIMQLLPGQHQTSLGSHKPRWRTKVPDDLGERVTNHDYWEQASFYAELAVGVGAHDVARLAELIDHLGNLPELQLDKLLEILASTRVSQLPEDQRRVLWEHLTRIASRHRRFSGAGWALSDGVIASIESVADGLAPTDPLIMHQHLFSGADSELYEENGDWEEQGCKLDERRETAIKQVFLQDGVDGVIRFAESVTSPSQVGHACGVIAEEVLDSAFLPQFLDTTSDKQRAFVGGFIWRRFHTRGLEWCDGLDRSSWTSGQIADFLVCLPFAREAWDRASQWLGRELGQYWSRTGANAWQAGQGDLGIAIDRLVEYRRPFAAIDCLHRMRFKGQSIDVRQCVRTLLAAVSSDESSSQMDGHHVVDLIKFLQTEPCVPREDLFRVEWAYLSLLDGHRGTTPIFLGSRLASEPEFFCEVIRLVYRSKKSDQDSRDTSVESRAIATNAWRLLHEWRRCPGSQDDGTFRSDQFFEWLQRVKEVGGESGHLEVALINVGEVLIHAPSDPGSLWIHRTVAAALNDRDAEGMRSGFATATYSSRGGHLVDPSGQPERDLSEQFRTKAEEVENAGFQRFAVTLKNLADRYARKAGRIVAEHSGGLVD